MLRIERHELPKRLLVGAPDKIARLVGFLPQTRPNTSAPTPAGTCLWLRPDQWLVLGATLPIAHEGSAAVLDAGSRWLTFKVSGARSLDLIASGCSLDLRPDAFGIGACAQTRIEQVPIILFRRALQEFDVLVERPLAQYLELWIDAAVKGIGD